MVEEASEGVLSRRPALGGLPAPTDAYWFHSCAGIPFIPAFRSSLLTLAYGLNEQVSTGGIIQAGKIYALSTLGYLDSESRGRIA